MKKTVKRTLSIFVALAMLAIGVFALTSCGCDDDGKFTLVINQNGGGKVTLSFCVPGARDGNELGADNGGENAEYYNIARTNDALTNAQAKTIADYVVTLFTANGWVQEDSATLEHFAEANAANGGTPLDFSATFTDIAGLNAKLNAIFAIHAVTGYTELPAVTLGNESGTYTVNVPLVTMHAPLWAVGAKLVEQNLITKGRVNDKDNNTNGIFSLATYSVTIENSADTSSKQTATAARANGDGDKEGSHLASKWTGAAPTGSLDSTANSVKASILIASGDLAAYRTTLSSKIAEGQAIAATGYTTASYALLTSAISAGQTELAKADAQTSQTALTNATTAITNAISGLEYINMFRGKATISNTAYAQISPTANAVDSLLNTRWESQREQTDPDPKPANGFKAPYWIGVNLGSAKEVGSVRIFWESCYATSFNIQSSTDGENWTNVSILGKGTAAFGANSGKNSGGSTTADAFEKYVFTQPVTAQYFRMYATAKKDSWSCSIWEFEGYAPDPADFKTALQSAITTAQTYTSTANKGYYRADLLNDLSAAITAAQTVYNDTSATVAQIQTAINSLEQPKANLFTGDLAFGKTCYKTNLSGTTSTGPTSHTSSSFAVASTATDEAMIVDLATAVTFDTIYIRFENGSKAFTLDVSDDGATWTKTVFTGTDANWTCTNTTYGNGYGFFRFHAVTARYVRIHSTLRYNSGYFDLKDFQVYNETARLSMIGAQLKTNDADSAKKDMRFVTEIIAPAFLVSRDIATAPYIASMGTLMARQDFLDAKGNPEITFALLASEGTANVKKVSCVYLNNTTEADRATYRFYSTITGISSGNFATTYVARSYIVMSDGTVYYSQPVGKKVNDGI